MNFKKVLVVDCDDTLWGGAVAEEGALGVRPHVEFQKAIMHLAKHGILVAVISKNNEQDVWDVFEKHPDMVLRRKDIVAARINWEDKAKNLNEIAKQLDLGADSFVFWDDNPLERETVRRNTEATVPNISNDHEEWSVAVTQEFYCEEMTAEDWQKLELYERRERFQKEKQTAIDETTFLKSLRMKPKATTLISDLVRAEQLCNKTNQFNLRTIRYSKEKLKAIAEDQSVVEFMVHLDDHYGTHGNVGLVIARVAGERAEMDTFLMSCRVLQRHLDSWMLYHCCELLEKRGVKELVVDYVPTLKNGMVATFLWHLDMKEENNRYIGSVASLLDKTKQHHDLFRC